ncbi:MAG: tRNA dimethylallyltransferase [Clostridiales bacterium]|nr:tRNA dimethylallyltransferase [Clostridiales bacterium]
MQKPLIVIVGPTAVGKTDVAIEVAQRINGSIISADATQVYKYMDIGSAKPTPEERKGIPHYMIDVVTPDEAFSVALFQRMAEQCIDEIIAQGRMPMLVGGTGLYINSMVYNLDFSEGTPDAELRENLRHKAQEYGVDALYNELADVDPDAAARINRNDLKRIIRALEVYYKTGRPISYYQQRSKSVPPRYNAIMIGLTMDRQRLYSRIEQRVDAMMEKGLLEEVKWLKANGYADNPVAMQAVGYKELLAYLKGLCTLDEAVMLIKRNTRRLAKRQWTWFNRDKNVRWFNTDEFESKGELVEHILEYIV